MAVLACTDTLHERLYRLLPEGLKATKCVRRNGTLLARACAIIGPGVAAAYLPPLSGASFIAPHCFERLQASLPNLLVLLPLDGSPVSYEETHEVEEPENPHDENYYTDLDVLALQFAGCLCFSWVQKLLADLALSQ